MAQLWFRCEESEEGHASKASNASGGSKEGGASKERWIAEGLAAERNLEEWVRRPAVVVRAGNGRGTKPAFALIAHAQSARVNGEPLTAGIRILRDRDEILCADGSRLWFSAESVAEVSLFDDGRDHADDGGSTSPVLCPRCRGAIEHGDEVVACPSCGLFYHWLESRRCYNFHRECVGCEGATVDVGDPAFAWTPCDL